uniref:Uncharacterized protein n=1 Tax=Arundo donax TaxID=35708 RepID=A0A0A9DHB4_ARUDO
MASTFNNHLHTTHMYPPQVLKHEKYPDPSPGTVHKVPPISPSTKIVSHIFPFPNSHLSTSGIHPSHHNHQRNKYKYVMVLIVIYWHASIAKHGSKVNHFPSMMTYQGWQSR